MLKKILGAVVLGVFACAALSSCSASPDDVKLYDAEQSKKYVEDNYCPCELVSEEPGDNQVIYTFKDKDYGFTFTFNCHASGQGMDGAVFFYDQSVLCDYGQCYDKWVTGNIQPQLDAVCEKYGCRLELKENYYLDMGVVYFEEEDLDKCDAALCEIGQLFADADKRSRYTANEIPCVAGYSSAGKFKFSEMRFMRLGSAAIGEMKAALEEYTGTEMEYLWADEFDDSEIYKLEEHTVTERPEGAIKVYYFSGVGGTQWCITDAKIETGKYYYFERDKDFENYDRDQTQS